VIERGNTLRTFGRKGLVFECRGNLNPRRPRRGFFVARTTTGKNTWPGHRQRSSITCGKVVEYEVALQISMWHRLRGDKRDVSRLNRVCGAQLGSEERLRLQGRKGGPSPVMPEDLFLRRWKPTPVGHSLYGHCGFDGHWWVTQTENKHSKTEEGS